MSRAIAGLGRGAMVAALMGLSCLASAADNQAGKVRVVKGDATVSSSDQSVQAAQETPVSSGSTIRTGAGSSLGVLFNDNTAVSFGPGTEAVINEYVYAPNQNMFRFEVKISKGSMAYLAGAIGKQRPGAVSILTPTGSVAIRGTHFAVKVDGQ